MKRSNTDSEISLLQRRAFIVDFRFFPVEDDHSVTKYLRNALISLPIFARLNETIQQSDDFKYLLEWSEIIRLFKNPNTFINDGMYWQHKFSFNTKSANWIIKMLGVHFTHRDVSASFLLGYRYAGYGYLKCQECVYIVLTMARDDPTIAVAALAHTRLISVIADSDISDDDEDELDEQVRDDIFALRFCIQLIVLRTILTKHSQKSGLACDGVRRLTQRVFWLNVITHNVIPISEIARFNYVAYHELMLLLVRDLQNEVYLSVERSRELRRIFRRVCRSHPIAWVFALPLQIYVARRHVIRNAKLMLRRIRYDNKLSKDEQNRAICVLDILLALRDLPSCRRAIHHPPQRRWRRQEYDEIQLRRYARQRIDNTESLLQDYIRDVSQDVQDLTVRYSICTSEDESIEVSEDELFRKISCGRRYSSSMLRKISNNSEAEDIAIGRFTHKTVHSILKRPIQPNITAYIVNRSTFDNKQAFQDDEFMARAYWVKYGLISVNDHCKLNWRFREQLVNVARNVLAAVQIL